MMNETEQQDIFEMFNNLNAGGETDAGLDK